MSLPLGPVSPSLASPCCGFHSVPALPPEVPELNSTEQSQLTLGDPGGRQLAFLDAASSALPLHLLWP